MFGEHPLLCVASTSACVSEGSTTACCLDICLMNRRATCEQKTPVVFQLSGRAQSSSVSQGSMADIQHCQRSP